ncbi:hypothetical protein A0O32_2524 [Anoxybacillus flavithermus]|uniref:Uncharacterized protein n=1 Tax=Anoxybacillus flavithermus TaxID=33934 RepID=A0A178T688_9BACL|nr:hypothetical protein TAF16_2460 [Anoxybacillus flavithermus]OAO77480.1 hypothetical protein A0O32_2524 [Anoxybacillus flavithermus]
MSTGSFALFSDSRQTSRFDKLNVPRNHRGRAFGKGSTYVV